MKLLLSLLLLAVLCVTVRSQKISDYRETTVLSNYFIFPLANPGVTNYKVTFGTLSSQIVAQVTLTGSATNAVINGSSLSITNSTNFTLFYDVLGQTNMRFLGLQQGSNIVLYRTGTNIVINAYGEVTIANLNASSNGLFAVETIRNAAVSNAVIAYAAAHGSTQMVTAAIGTLTVSNTFSVPIFNTITGNFAQINLTNALNSNQVWLGMAQLTNVQLAGLVEGHSLFYNAANAKFTNAPGGSGSGTTQALTMAIGTLTQTNSISFVLSNQANIGSFLIPAKTNYANAFVALAGGTNHFGTTVFDNNVTVQAATSGQNYLSVNDTNGTARLKFGIYPGFPEFGTLWLGDVTPAVTNYSLTSDGTTTTINGFGTITLATGSGGSKWIVSTAGDFLASTDGIYSFGAAGATRPLHFNLAGGLVQGASNAAPAAPSVRGAVYWTDGTNLCAVFRNGAGTLTTNKLTMSAWP